MARKFSKNELGVEAKTYVKDVKKLNEIDIKADIILLWGFVHIALFPLGSGKGLCCFFHDIIR